jgi:hypothetical protein
MAAAKKPTRQSPPRKPAARRPTAAKATAPKATKAATPKVAKPKAKAPQAKTGGKPRIGLISAITVGIIAAGSAIALFGRRLFTPGNAEHPAPDLALDAPRPGTDRAPDAFRPDPTAPVPAAEREALRPPSLVTH